MKERPVRLVDAMARAAVAGRKSQLRILVAPQPEWIDESGWCWRSKHANLKSWPDETALADALAAACPLGQPGDLLWLQEAFFDTSPFAFAPLFAERSTPIAYRADGDKIGCHRWRPSVHMSRHASRLSLKITAVRAERLQTITKDDVLAEGFCARAGKAAFNSEAAPEYFIPEQLAPCDTTWPVRSGANASPQEAYRAFWSATHGPESWNDNRWVFVVSFAHFSGEPNP